MISLVLAMQFARQMAERFHARLVRKSDAIEMKLVAAALEAARLFGARLPSTDEFLTRYATTIGPMIYLPDSMWDDPRALVEVVTHECQHVRQFWRGSGDGVAGPTDRDLPGGFGFGWLYLTQGEARVRFEAEAYVAGLEATVIGIGEPLPTSLEPLVQPLEGGYALNDGEIALARGLLEVGATQVAQGVALTDAGQTAVELLRQLGVGR
jgi:hypothetical protein